MYISFHQFSKTKADLLSFTVVSFRLILRRKALCSTASLLGVTALHLILVYYEVSGKRVHILVQQRVFAPVLHNIITNDKSVNLVIISKLCVHPPAFYVIISFFLCSNK